MPNVSFGSSLQEQSTRVRQHTGSRCQSRRACRGVRSTDKQPQLHSWFDIPPSFSWAMALEKATIFMRTKTIQYDTGFHDSCKFVPDRTFWFGAWTSARFSIRFYTQSLYIFNWLTSGRKISTVSINQRGVRVGLRFTDQSMLEHCSSFYSVFKVFRKRRRTNIAELLTHPFRTVLIFVDWWRWNRCYYSTPPISVLKPFRYLSKLIAHSYIRNQ